MRAEGIRQQESLIILYHIIIVRCVKIRHIYFCRINNQFKMHRRIVQRSRLVYVNIQAVVGLHLQCSLHSSTREAGPRPAAVLVAFLVEAVNLRQSAFSVVVFLRVVVAGNPPRCVVARQAKPRHFLLEPKAYQRVVHTVVPHRKFVAESQAIVIQPKPDLHYRGSLVGRAVHTLHFAHRLLERHQHLIVVVADIGFFAPNGLPNFVKRVKLYFLDNKIVNQVITPLKFKAQLRAINHRLSVSHQFIRYAALAKRGLPPLEI